jgi:hypothetical protein
MLRDEKMTGRFQSYASLGLLSVLAAGFGLWSAFSGPQNAAVQLHAAAANTLAASGFVETFQSIPTATPAKSSEPTTTIFYQAPDRFATVGSYEVNGSKVPTELRMTQIGSVCWEEPAADNPGAPSAENICTPSGSSQFLGVLQDLEDASGVTLRGGVYSVDQQDTEPFVRGVFGPFAKLFKGQSVEVRTDGSYVSWLHIVLDIRSGRLAGHPFERVVIGFRDVGTAPAVVRPAPEPSPATTVAPTTASTNAGPPTLAPPTTLTASTPTTLAG